MTSADSRLAASSNEIRVRVEFSRKKFTTVRPRSAGTFLMTRVPTSRNDSAVSRTRTTSSADTSLIDSRCLFIVPLPSPACGASSRSILHVHGVFAVHLLQRGADRLVLPGRYVLAYEVGPDRQFAVPSIHQD